MRHRRTVVVVLALGLVAAACKSSAEPVGLPLEIAPPSTVAGAVPVSANVVRPPPGPILGEPINIPANSYASEQVVQIGKMEIPKLRLDHPIFQGVTLHNIDRGPSHWPGSAIPGQVGNTVFAGHRVTKSSPFRNIDDLEVGDEVSFTVNGARSLYRVTASMVVDDADSWIADQTPTPTGTLYACHPPGSVDKRYVVRLALDVPPAPSA